MFYCCILVKEPCTWTEVKCTLCYILELFRIILEFYSRDFSHFDKDLFVNDLENIDFNQLINEDVNESINNVISALQTLSDKHAPVKKLSSPARNLLTINKILKILLKFEMLKNPM